MIKETGTPQSSFVDQTSNSPWTFDGESAPLTTSGPLVTLIDGRSFSLSATSGDITNQGPQGLFFLDTRLLKKFVLLVNDQPLEPLGFAQHGSYEACFVSRHHGSRRQADTPVVVFRSRNVGQGMTETIKINNYGETPVELAVSLHADADFAGLFEVKEGRVTSAASTSVVKKKQLWFVNKFETSIPHNVEIEVSSQPEPHNVQPNVMSWNIIIEPNDSWHTELKVAPWLAGVRSGPLTSDSPLSASKQLANWKAKVPKIETNHPPLSVCANSALTDLASLRIFDPKRPDQPVIAAGAPWFMTLFGRDSLITSWMGLLVDPDLASGVLQTLARHQGTDINEVTEEQPGKIIHEMRFAGADSGSLDDGHLYYGTADATPLFVMLLGELRRWGVHNQVADKLIGHADRALEWIENFGDSDGDGFVEYQRSTTIGLENQGWKDSWDGIRYNNGRVAKAPIALCEVQAYTYAAYRARARFAEEAGDQALGAEWEQKAHKLRKAFNQQFWLEDKQWFAVGLDGDKKPIDSLTSNIGHCLWTGIVDEEKAPLIAKHLVADDLFTGWGVRTLARSTPGYNPTGYHVGSVWPHDTAIAAAGLMRYGFIEESHRIMLAVLDAGYRANGRLPELMSGFDRADIKEPISYPASCSPQAWAAASPLLLLRWMLRLDPWCSRDRVWVDPVLPEGIDRLHVEGIRIGQSRVTINVEKGVTDIVGLPETFDVKRGLRPPAPRRQWPKPTS